MTGDPRFKIGDVVQLRPRAEALGIGPPRTLGRARLGMVLGYSRTNLPRVGWEGMATLTAYDPSFLVRVDGSALRARIPSLRATPGAWPHPDPRERLERRGLALSDGENPARAAREGS